ncbi:MAG: hypothetical protein ABH859_00480 [Pseudomonadota bacterium]
MSININNNIKATDLYSENQTSDVNNQAEELQNQLEDALLDLQNMRDENEMLISDEQMFELDRLEAIMKSEIAALEAKDFAGAASGSNIPGWDTSMNPDTLEPGWNISEGGTMRSMQDAQDEQALYDRFGDDVTYTETVRIESDRIGYYAADPEVERLDVVSIGSDLAFILTKKDGTKEAIVLENGSVRRENANEDIVIKAHDSGMTIDCSQAYIVGDGRHGLAAGEVAGFSIWGGAGNDTLIGSNGHDSRIVGGAGDDIIHGLGGRDNIAGDNWYVTPGTDGTGTGDDYIDGGRGEDVIMGGGGIDSGVVESHDSAVDMGGDVVAPNYTPVDPEEWLDFDETQWELYEDENGLTALRHIGDQGSAIDINLPLDNAFAERSDNDLIITFTGLDESGDMTQFSFRIDDFFRNRPGIDPASAVVTLNIHGNSNSNIIDFRCQVENQVVNIFGGDGQDAIYGTDAALLRDGIDTSSWQESSVSQSELENYADRLNDNDLWGQFENEAGEEVNGYSAEAVDGQIVVTRNPEADIDIEDPENVIQLHAPAGYDNAYITEGSDGHTYVILADGEGHYITVKFANTDLDFTRINIKHGNASTVEGLRAEGLMNPIPITFEDDMYVVNGGEGADTIVVPSGTNVENDGLDSVVTYNIDDSAAPLPEYTGTSGDVDGDADSDEDVDDEG